MSDEEATTRRADPGEIRQQRDTSAADASSDIHSHSTAAGEESELFDSELPLLERQGVDAAAPIPQWAAADISSNPHPAIKVPATVLVPPNTAPPLSMPDIRNHEDSEEGKENSAARLRTTRQCVTTMHAHMTVLAAAGEDKSTRAPNDRAAGSQPLCFDTGLSQRDDIDNSTRTGSQAKQQQAQSYNHDSSEDIALHGQDSIQLRCNQLSIAADVTMQNSSGRVASRSRPAVSVALAPRHPAKAIWLGFVRRAYRKFGKDMLSTVDLRWKMTGASVLAAAWRRTDVARKIIAAITPRLIPQMLPPLQVTAGWAKRQRRAPVSDVYYHPAAHLFHVCPMLLLPPCSVSTHTRRVGRA